MERNLILSEADFDARSGAIVEEIEAWFKSLPEGVAEMQVSWEPGTVVTVQMRPRLAENAPAVFMFMDWDELEIRIGPQTQLPPTMYAGTLLPRTLPPVDAMKAVVSGNISKTEYVWGGHVILEAVEIRTEDGQAHCEWHRRSPLGCLAPPAVWRWTLLTKRARTTHYPPYFRAASDFNE